MLDAGINVCNSNRGFARFSLFDNAPTSNDTLVASEDILVASVDNKTASKRKIRTKFDRGHRSFL